MRHEFKTSARRAAILAVAGLMLTALPASAAKAPQAPRPGCIPASKTEYNSAIKKQIHGRFGTYVRTRALWHRYYWYCPL